MLEAHTTRQLAEQNKLGLNPQDVPLSVKLEGMGKRSS